MKVDKLYDDLEKEAIRDTKLGAWVHLVLYTVPGGVLFALLVWFGVDEAYWTPVMLLYAIGAFSHIAGTAIGSLLHTLTLTSPVNYQRLKNEADESGDE